MIFVWFRATPYSLDCITSTRWRSLEQIGSAKSGPAEIIADDNGLRTFKLSAARLMVLEWFSG